MGMRKVGRGWGEDWKEGIRKGGIEKEGWREEGVLES